MKKLLSIVLAATIALGLVGCAQAEELNGIAKGFAGEVTVVVTVEDGKIVSVVATGVNETNGIGTKALEELPAKIVEAGSTDVDVIAGATVTSNAIKAAVNNALDPVAYPYVVEEEKPAEKATAEAADAFIGLGVASMGRLGPGKDDKDVQVYSFNQVVAGVVFDAEGRILMSKFDQLEIATPNYDGATMPHLSGFPGQTAYNYDSDHDGKVDSVMEMTDDSFLAEVESWQTKRERGEGYVMGTGYWAQQMDTFERLFAGKTVEEVKEWFAKYCSDRNGRPLKADSSNEQDAAKYNALTEDEKAMLADVTAGATMSLNDGHGNILAALEKAAASKVEVELTIGK